MMFRTYVNPTSMPDAGLYTVIPGDAVRLDESQSQAAECYLESYQWQLNHRKKSCQ